MTALSHGWSVLPPKDIGCNRNISISDIWFREVVSNRNFENEEQVILTETMAAAYIISGKER